ncbi:MAG TPA: nucleotide exchange factor GrpE [Syntrophales bacterium]|nr:nucleotide exchange factor GrpE [Syntrophales bacterium]
MVKKGKKESVAAATFETSSAPEAADGHAESDRTAGEDLDVLRAKLQEKEREAAENYDRYVRAVADLENHKKRALRDKADAVKYGNENVIRDLLPLTDGLDRALRQAEASCDFEAFRKGLEMLRAQLLGSLEKHGVQAIDSLEKPFDPNVHEAMMQVDSDAHEDNQVVDEFEKGYTLNGRLLRPARVSVCKKRTNEDVCE